MEDQLPDVVVVLFYLGFQLGLHTVHEGFELLSDECLGMLRAEDYDGGYLLVGLYQAGMLLLKGLDEGSLPEGLEHSVGHPCELDLCVAKTALLGADGEVSDHHQVQLLWDF